MTTQRHAKKGMARVEKARATQPVFRAYRIRMRFLAWYIDLFTTGDKPTHEMGPFDFKTANAEADKLGLPDYDKGVVA